MLGPPQKGRDDGRRIPVSRQFYLFDALGKNSQDEVAKIGRDCEDKGPGRALKSQLLSTRPHPLIWRCLGSSPVVRAILSINYYPRQRFDSAHHKPGIKRRENGTGCVLDELMPLDYLGGVGGVGGVARAGEGKRKGIPAANHDPPLVTRMRSTGLVQVFGGSGESES
jgi:hypothetical protein